jgi:hypothetical protein
VRAVALWPSARDAGDAKCAERRHFAGIGGGVLIAVEPHADSIEFAAAQPAVVIVVKGRERLEAVAPEKLPRVVAEHLPR